MLQVINMKGNSQGKDLLKLVLFPCKTYIKLWTDPAQIISREPLLNNITLFFPVSGGLDYSSLRTEKGIPQNVAVISSWTHSTAVASFITAKSLHLSQNQERNLENGQPVL